MVYGSKNYWLHILDGTPKNDDIRQYWWCQVGGVTARLLSHQVGWRLSQVDGGLATQPIWLVVGTPPLVYTWLIWQLIYG